MRDPSLEDHVQDLRVHALENSGRTQKKHIRTPIRVCSNDDMSSEVIEY